MSMQFGAGKGSANAALPVLPSFWEPVFSKAFADGSLINFDSGNYFQFEQPWDYTFTFENLKFVSNYYGLYYRQATGTAMTLQTSGYLNTQVLGYDTSSGPTSGAGADGSQSIPGIGGGTGPTVIGLRGSDATQAYMFGRCTVLNPAAIIRHGVEGTYSRLYYEAGNTQTSTYVYSFFRNTAEAITSMRFGSYNNVGTLNSGTWGGTITVHRTRRSLVTPT